MQGVRAMSSEQLNHLPHWKITNNKDYARRMPPFLSTLHVVLQPTGSHLIFSCQQSRSNQEGPTLFGWWSCSSPEKPYCHPIASSVGPNLWPRTKQRMECGGPFELAPISTSIHCLTRGLGEIRVGFSQFFIGRVDCISTSASTINL